jgi:hypothetical protein
MPIIHVTCMNLDKWHRKHLLTHGYGNFPVCGGASALINLFMSANCNYEMRERERKYLCVTENFYFKHEWKKNSISISVTGNDNSAFLNDMTCKNIRFLLQTVIFNADRMTVECDLKLILCKFTEGIKRLLINETFLMLSRLNNILILLKLLVWNIKFSSQDIMHCTHTLHVFNSYQVLVHKLVINILWLGAKISFWDERF